MSFVQVSLADVVKNQYAYKLRSFKGFISTLILTQIVAILFALNGTYNSWGSYDDLMITIEVKGYSAETVIAFTLVWAIITGLSITTKVNRYNDFAFVTNRLSNNLSNMLFLLTVCSFAGATAMLSSFLIRTIIYILNKTGIFSINFIEFPAINLGDFLVGLLACILYMVLFGTAGYIIGMIVQCHPIFIVVLPVSVVGLLFFENYIDLKPILQFYISETSILLFFIKVVVTVCVCFGIAIALSNRLEVRQ